MSKFMPGLGPDMLGKYCILIIEKTIILSVSHEEFIPNISGFNHFTPKWLSFHAFKDILVSNRLRAHAGSKNVIALFCDF